MKPYIHALLRKHIHSTSTGSSIEVFSQYIKNTKGAEQQHVIMAGEYILPLADALKKFDEAKEADSFYLNLAWDGIPKQFRNPEITDNTTESTRNMTRNKGLNCN